MEVVSAFTFVYLSVVLKTPGLPHATAALRNLPFMKAGTELLKQLYAHLSSLERECGKDFHGSHWEKIFTHFSR